MLDGLMYVSFVSLTWFSFLRYTHCLLPVAFKGISVATLNKSSCTLPMVTLEWRIPILIS